MWAPKDGGAVGGCTRDMAVWNSAQVFSLQALTPLHLNRPLMAHTGQLVLIYAPHHHFCFFLSIHPSTFQPSTSTFYPYSTRGRVAQNERDREKDEETERGV
jgi:hypothetical protein